jgi:acid stress chaperone HdeB
MKKVTSGMLCAVLLGLSIFVVPTVQAGEKAVKKDEKVDMASYTCADLLAEKEDDVGMILLWVDGYLSGKTGDTVINMKFVGELAESVGTKCAEKGEAKLLDVVKDLTETE